MAGRLIKKGRWTMADLARIAGVNSSVAAPESAAEGWQLAMTDEGRSDNAARAETLFGLANGALGVRGGREEQSSPTDGTLLARVFESVPIRYHESFPGFARASDARVPVADGKRIRVRLGERATAIACHAVGIGFDQLKRRQAQQ